MVGCSRKQLRSLQAHKLIAPVRNRGQQRYDRENARRLWLILLLQDLGYPIAQIKAMLDVGENAPDAGYAATALSATIDRVVDRIDAKVRDLQLARESLVAARGTLEACGGCERDLEACRGCADSGKLDGVTKVTLAGLGGARPRREADAA
jgi:DNA-binding transcriptional MerR regulator